MTCEELQLQPRKRYQPDHHIGNRSKPPGNRQDEPMTLDPFADPDRPIRWGILGTGWIASEFAGDLAAPRRRRARRRRLAEPAERRRLRPPVRGAERATRRTPSWWPIPTSTRSTSPLRTRCTSPTRCSRSRRARRCSARSRSPSTPPRRARSSPRRGARDLPDGGDVDAVPAAHGPDPLAAR